MAKRSEPAKTKEEAAHEAKLIARRNRRARKKAEEQRENGAAMAQLAENEHAEEVTAESPSYFDPVKLGIVKAAVVGGRQTPKRMTEARENLSIAFEEMGGIPALVYWGQRNPTEFYRIWARLIPKEAPTDASKSLPLEDLLERLAQRADQSVTQAALEIGQEVLDKAAEDVILEDAIAAFNGES